MVNRAVGFGLGGEGSRVLTEEMGGKAGFLSVLPHFAWFAAEGVGFLTFFQEKQIGFSHLRFCEGIDRHLVGDVLPFGLVGHPDGILFAHRDGLGHIFSFQHLLYLEGAIPFWESALGESPFSASSAFL